MAASYLTSGSSVWFKKISFSNYMDMDSAVFPKLNAYLSHYCSGNKSIIIYNMFTKSKKICMCICLVGMKRIGTVCLAYD